MSAEKAENGAASGRAYILPEDYVASTFPWTGRKLPKWAAPALLAGIALLYLPLIHGELGGMGGDNCYYIANARSFIEAESLADLFYTDPVFIRKIWSADSYMCGFFSIVLSLALVPGVLDETPNYLYIHFVVYLFAMAAPVMSYLYFRRRAGEIRAAGYALLFATTHLYLINMMDVLTEAVFTALIFGVFILAEKYREDTRTFSRWLAALAVICFAALTTRRPGVVVPVAAALTLFSGGPFKDKWKGSLKKTIAFCASFAALLIAYFIPLAIMIAGIKGRGEVPAAPSYIAGGNWLDSVEYTGDVARIFFFEGHVIAGWMNEIGAVITAVIFIGALADLIRNRSASAWFFWAYLLLIVLFDTKDSRYLMPLIPIMFFYAGEGFMLSMRAADEYFWKKYFGWEPKRVYANGLLAACFIVLVSLHAAGAAKWAMIVTASPSKPFGSPDFLGRAETKIDWSKYKNVHGWVDDGEGWKKALLSQEFMDLNLKLKDLAGKEDVVLSVKPRITRVLTGVKSSRMKDDLSLEAFMEFARVSRARYVISSRFHHEETWAAKEAAIKYPDCFRSVWRSSLNGGEILEADQSCSALAAGDRGEEKE